MEEYPNNFFNFGTYCIGIFSHPYLTNENSLIRIYDKVFKNGNSSIGWVVPYNSLFSFEHQFTNDYYLIKNVRVCYEFIRKLSTDLPDELPDKSEYLSYLSEEHAKSLTEFEKDLKDFKLDRSEIIDSDLDKLVFIVFNREFLKINSLEIEPKKYFFSLWAYGYTHYKVRKNSCVSFKKLMLSQIHNEVSFKITDYLCKLSRQSSSISYISFLMYYQVFELLFDEMMTELIKININNLAETKITRMDVKLSITTKKESDMLCTIFEIIKQKEDVSELNIKCKELLIDYSIEPKDHVHENLYKVRNLLVHQLHSIMISRRIDLLDAINCELSIILPIMFSVDPKGYYK